MALHRRSQLRLLRHARDQALHLLLPRTLRNPPLQNPVVGLRTSSLSQLLSITGVSDFKSILRLVQRVIHLHGEER